MFLTKDVVTKIVYQLQADSRAEGFTVLKRQGNEPAPEFQAKQVRKLLTLLLGLPDLSSLSKALEAGIKCPSSATSREAAIAAVRQGFHWRAVDLLQQHLKGGLPSQIVFAPRSNLSFIGSWPDVSFVRNHAASLAHSLLEEPACLMAQPAGSFCEVFNIDDIDFGNSIEADGTRRVSVTVMAEFHEPLANGKPDLSMPYVGFHLKMEFELGRARVEDGLRLVTNVNPLGHTAWGFCTIDPRKANGG